MPTLKTVMNEQGGFLCKKTQAGREKALKYHKNLLNQQQQQLLNCRNQLLINIEGAPE